VTEDALERQIQDYLDERMSDSERRAFEERLATDAALAGRVRDLRAISRALGQDSPDLPPGFHTRLRARFEERQAPTRHWFRPLSWETAGLVAAVAIAAVLFVPFVVEQQPGRPESRILLEPSDKELGQSELPEAVEEDRLEEVGAEGLDIEESSMSGDDDARFAPYPESAPSPAKEPEPEYELGRRDAPAKSRPAEAPGAKQKKRDSSPSRQAAPAEPERAKRARVEEKAAVGALGDAKDEVRAQSDPYGDRFARPGGVSLTAGVVGAGEVIEIRSAEQWSRLALDVEPATGNALGEYDPSTRLVLVGARDNPIDCANSAVVAVADAYEIRLAAPAVSPTEPVHGCAFRVPAGDLAVRVVDPSESR